MTLTIIGRPISKKNSKRLIRVGGRIIPISSKAYMAFEKDAVAQIITQLNKITPTGENLIVNYLFYLKGKGMADVDNLVSGINDILQKANVILDDRQIMEFSGKKILGCPEYKTEVTIYHAPTASLL